ncbi:MAG: hypothetical protein ACLUTF_09705 [Anaerostipes hadrus]
MLKGIKLFTKIPFKYLSESVQIGIPTAIQGMVYRGISMNVTAWFQVWSRSIAVQRVGGQIESVSWNTADGFGTALNATYRAKLWSRKDGSWAEKDTKPFVQLEYGESLLRPVFVFQTKGNRRDFLPEPKAIIIAIGYLTICWGSGRLWL